MMIGFNNFQAEPEELLQAELAVMEEVLRSGWYILGQQVQRFESDWAAICGVNYAVGVGNGMDALEIGLRCLEIGPGDEVITTSMTAFATVLAILRAGASPVLADIDPTTALLNPESVARCISSRTKAVLLVHLYGQVAQMNRWLELCSSTGVFLLEDCAQSHLAAWQGKSVGSFGAWGGYSFYPTKNLGAIGDAGVIVTDSSEIAQKAEVLRNYGQSQRYYHTEIGLNSRLDELQAGLLRIRLQWLESFTQRRKEIAEAYFLGIDNPKIQLLSPPMSPENHVYHLFVILCERRNALSDFLQAKGINTLIHYPVPVHHQSPTNHLLCDPEGLTIAENHATSCLSLPIHPHMSDRDVKYIISTINQFR